MARDMEEKEAACGTAEAMLRQVAEECCSAFDAHLARLMETDDPEGPHKARVALRRLRTALMAFDPILAPKFARKSGRRARDLFRIIGDLRDADVRDDHRGKESERTDRIRQKVRKRLKKRKAVCFTPKLGKTLAGKGWTRGGRRAQVLAEAPAALIGGRALGDAWATCLSHGIDLEAMPDEARHELRKDLKTMRYTAEFFGPVWPGEPQETFLDRMKDLQDELGHLNDLAMLGGAEAGEGGDSRSLRKAGRIWAELAAMPVWWSEGAGRPATDEAAQASGAHG
ncbi:CHAD domain-containing protein [Cereibacter azotoformans]|uniref:CHAD domain containing protein n=1 Tax=Cereibacter sphaeroides (strain ATCC 17025 / ATH 2.4.3) TaxID=349102 RepID=A4WV07_CERS5|nr:CHAD domain-containing protein [Cereibacter azotoformans]ULB10435.1 CHAD domain-containing protein [Cereibacter azotoformans]